MALQVGDLYAKLSLTYDSVDKAIATVVGKVSELSQQINAVVGKPIKLSVDTGAVTRATTALSKLVQTASTSPIKLTVTGTGQITEAIDSLRVLRSLLNKQLALKISMPAVTRITNAAKALAELTATSGVTLRVEEGALRSTVELARELAAALTRRYLLQLDASQLQFTVNMATQLQESLAKAASLAAGIRTAVVPRAPTTPAQTGTTATQMQQTAQVAQSAATAATQAATRVSQSTQSAATQASSAAREVQERAQQAGQAIERAAQQTEEAATRTRTAWTQTCDQAAEAAELIKRAFGGGVQSEAEGARRELQHFTWQVRGYIKDTSRIITGILISQGFYRTWNAIQDCIAAAIEFNNELQRASISFETLTGSAEMARDMILALQDFAARTPFTFQDAELGARRLLAMGFAAKNLIPIMQDIADMTAVVGGGPEVLDRIVRALGQIQTKGRLMQQEVNQLAEVGVPIYDILSEKLKLTKEQMENLGKVHVPAGLAIRAILQGIEENFGGAAEKMQQTTAGIWSNIVDRFLYMAGTILDKPMNLFRRKLQQLSDWMGRVWEGFMKGGPKGLFEALVPPNLQGAILEIIGAIQILYRALQKLWDTLRPLLSGAGQTIIRVLSLILPPLAQLINVIADIIKYAVTASPVIRALGKALGVLVIAAYVTVLLQKLYAALKWLLIAGPVASVIVTLAEKLQELFLVMARNPIVAVIMVLASALIYLAMSCDTVRNAMDRMMSRFLQWAGVDTSKVFTEQADATDAMAEALNKFNENLAKGSLDLSQIGEDADKAGNKVKDKFIASFDEVFQVPEKLDDVAAAIGGIDTNIPKLEIPKFGRPGTGDEGGGGGGGGGILPLLIPPFTKLRDLIRNLQRELDGLRDRLRPPWPPNPAYAFAEETETALEKVRNAYRAAREALRQPIFVPPPVFPPITVPVPEPVKVPVERPEVPPIKVPVPEPVEVPVKRPEVPPLKLPEVPPVLVYLTLVGGAAALVLLQNLHSTLNALKEGARVVQEALEAAFKRVKDVVEGVGKALQEAYAYVSKLPAAVQAAYAAIVGILGAALQEAKQALLAPLQAVREFLQTTGQSIVQWVSDHKALLAGAALAIVGLIVLICTGGLGAVVELITGAGASIVAFFAKFGPQLEGALSNASGAISAWVAGVLAAISGFVVAVGTWFARHKDEIIKAITGWITDTKTKIETWVKETKQKISDWVNTVTTNLRNAVQNIIKQVSELPEKIRKIGQEIVTGLWSGIQDRLDWLWSKIRSWGQSIERYIREHTKVHSPSEMTAEVGRELTAGLVEGMMASLNKVRTAAAMMATAVTEGTSGIGDTLRQQGLDAASGLLSSMQQTVPLSLRPEVIPATQNYLRRAVTPVPVQQVTPDGIVSAVAAAVDSALRKQSYGTGEQLPPVYVGTLIADQRGLVELERRLQLVRLNESARRGVLSSGNTVGARRS